MERTRLESKIKDIINDVLIIDPDTINETDSIVDLGADSLDCVEIVMECEKEFRINIDNGEMDSIQTVKDLYDIVERKISKK